MKKFKVKTNLLDKYRKGSLIDVHTRDKLLCEGAPLSWFDKQEEITSGNWAFFKGHNDTYEYFFRITEVEDHTVRGYGFDGERGKDEWFDECSVCNPEAFIRYATDKEVQKALQREAKRRGFVNDKYFKSLDIGRFSFGSHTQSYKSSSNREARVGSSWFYNEARDYLAVTGWGYPYIVYSCGEWAELGSQPIRINDHQVEPKDGHVKVGCLDVTNQFVEQLDYILQKYHVTLTDAEGKDLKDVIHQIAGDLS